MKVIFHLSAAQRGSMVTLMVAVSVNVQYPQSGGFLDKCCFDSLKLFADLKQPLKFLDKSCNYWDLRDKCFYLWGRD